MSTSTPNPIPTARQHKLALKLADSNNIAEPVLKQQKLDIAQQRKAQVETIEDNQEPCTAGALNLKCTQSVDIEDEIEGTDDYSNNGVEILEEFVLQKHNFRKGRAGREVGASEMAEKEL
ncbi:hypothetical protein C0991_008062, partial [Blastosporella zonata]